MSRPCKPAGAPWLWPREHGAYMQLGFPLLSAWVLGRPDAAAFALGAAAVLAFLAHEPLMVAVGGRGARRRREQGPAARQQLTLLMGLGGAMGGVGLWLADPMVRWLALAAVACAAPAALLALRGRERSLPAELYLSAVLASLALPVAVASGMAMADAASLVLVWAMGFGLGTLAARGVLLQRRDGGMGLRVAASVAVMVVAGGAALTVSGLVPSAWVLAPLPFAVVALGVAFKPPPPRRMMAMGFTLMGACVATLLVLWVGPGA